MNIKQEFLKNIHPYKNNPRINDKSVTAVINSIKKFGWTQPIVVNKNNIIVIGHVRYKAATKMGLEKVPVYQVDYPEESEKFKSLVIVDNKTGELSRWDFQKLSEELSSFSEETIDLLKDTGLKSDMLEFLLEKTNNDIENSLSKQSFKENQENPEFLILVSCKNENEQKILFNDLKEQSYNCKIV